MPRRKGPNSELMVRAAAEGGRLAAQGQEAVLSERQQAAASVQEQAGRASQNLIAVGEAEKDRDLQRERFAEDKRQYEEEKAIRLADKGIEEVPAEQGGAAPPGGAAQDPEAKNAQEQGVKPMEMATTGKSRFILGEERKEKGKAELSIKQTQAETARLREQRLRDKDFNDLQDAQWKRDQETMKQVKSRLMVPLRATKALYDGIGNGTLTDEQWGGLKETLTDAQGNQHPSAGLMSEVESKTYGPELKRFIGNRMAFQAIEYVLRSGGDLPSGDEKDGNLVDDTNPIWNRFRNQVFQMSGIMGAAGLGNFLNVENLDHKQRLANQAAAMVMMLQPMLGGASSMMSAGGPQGGAGPVQQQQPASIRGQPYPPAAGPPAQPQPVRKQSSVGERVEQYGFSGGGPR